ncbi:MAG: trimeric intracellular cation channel family protein [Betaproteobacteria bacterium]|nr:MAG: trimeric intracellular cation channel family protein [Betaproteobacteria bacterium]
MLYIIELCAVAVCAISGVLEAGRKKVDLFGVVVVALVAALGGGTLRDLLLGAPIFWIADQTYLYAAIAAGLLTFLAARYLRLPRDIFVLPDAAGLALFAVLGTEKALDLGAPWLVASLMGVITGVFGGVLRDVLCNEVPLVFTGELYATAAWSGALLFVLLAALGVEPAPASAAGIGLIFVARVAAYRWKIGLPRYSSKR